MTKVRANGARSALLVHRYFWPDTPPYASMLKSIAGRLVDDGWRVSVLTSQPSYGPDIPPQPWHETMDGAAVIRCRLFGESKGNWPARVANLLLFSAKVAWHLLRNRYDVVMAATTPPVVVARSASAAAFLRGSRFIYHCQDIHPEISENAGLLSSRAVTSFLRWLDGRTCRTATAIVVLSRDMAETLVESRGVASRKTRIINNFELDSRSAKGALPAELEKPRDVFRVLFAGNIGYFQGLDTVIAAADRLRDSPGIELVFMGDGAGVERLKAQAGDLLGRTVKFVGRYPQSIAEQALASADLGLISVDANVYRYAYPSKTMTYLKAGCPLLVVVETDSELARLVRDRGLGVCSPPGDVQQLSEAIRGASNAGPVTQERRQQIRLAGGGLFSRDQALDKWSELFSELAGSRSSRHRERRATKIFG